MPKVSQWSKGTLIMNEALGSRLVSCRVGPLFGERPRSPSYVSYTFITLTVNTSFTILTNKKRNLIIVVELKRAP